MVVNLRYVLPLHELSRADAPRVGAKAANLGDLLRAGFNVPAGFTLTIDAFERFRAHHGFGDSAAPNEVAAASLPTDVADELLAAHTALADFQLAVRSSGVAEDLPGASFAGQYETLLGVRGEAALLAAVARCWASAFAERVGAYSEQRMNGHFAPLAVLVQQLVPAYAAGVAFTANPVTGRRDEVVVNAVRGLGERLVSGTAQPDEFTVRHGVVQHRQVIEDAVRDDQVSLIAETARRIEGHFGSPQDVEWAIAGEELFVLQARPVTALPAPQVEQVPIPIDVPAGFWQREFTHFPRPASPMLGGFIHLENAAFREMFSAYGLLLEGLEFRQIGGWMYVRAVPLGGVDRKAPPWPVMWLLARAVPQLRRRMADCKAAIGSDLHGRQIEQWYAEWKPDLAQMIEDFAGVDLPALADDRLIEHFGGLEKRLEPCVRIHFLLHGAMIMMLAEFGFACRDMLGWDDRRTFELLNGLSEMSSEPTRRLAEVAQLASSIPAVRTLLDRPGDAPLAEVLVADAGFSAAFHAYLKEFGCRALGYEFIEPTLGERPEFVLGLVGDQVRRGYDPAANARALAQRRAAVLDEARASLRERPADLAHFERALARAERAYPVREDSEFYTVSAPLGLFRMVALEIGLRLAARGQLDVAADVFMLTADEARAALVSGERQHERLVRRRGERAWAEAHPGPATYGHDPGPPPETRGLPAAARFAMDAVQWVLLDRILAPAESARIQSAGDQIVGIAASAGNYTGPVRVVMDETEFAKVQSGDVLVCPITSPVWSVLFPSIGALVTDTGGILSHAAIIAREYRLPAVVGTGNATALLHDGQLVTVDGDAGLVTRVAQS